MHIYFELPCFFQCGKILICRFNLFIRFHHWSQYKIRNIQCHVTSHTWVKNTIVQLWGDSKISSRTFYVGRNTCHRRVYFLWLILFDILVRLLLYFLWCARTSFCVFRVPDNSLLWIFQSRKICDPVILRSTSEARICISIVTFSTFIFEIARIQRWTVFIIALYFYLLFETILSWVWFPTMTELWARIVSLSVSLTELSKFKKSICKTDKDIYFDQQKFLLPSTLLGGYLFLLSISPLYGFFKRRC